MTAKNTVESESIQYLTRDFLSGLSGKLEDRDVDLSSEGIPGKVTLLELTAGLRDYWEASMLVDAQEGIGLALRVDDKGSPFSKIAGELMRSRIVALSLAERIPTADPDKFEFRRMFKPGDEQQVKTWPARIVTRIATEALALNGISDEEFAQIKNDSAAIAGAASESDSPASEESPSVE